MASDHTYTIILKNETSDSAVTGDSPIAGNLNSSTTGQAQSGFLKNPEARKAFAQGMVAYHAVKSFATQIVSHDVGNVALKTGQNEMQARAQFNYSVGMRVLGGVESILVGAAVGGLPGAIAGATLSVAHTMVDIVHKQQDIDLKQSLENIQIRQNIIRAGGVRRNV